MVAIAVAGLAACDAAIGAEDAATDSADASADATREPSDATMEEADDGAPPPDADALDTVDANDGATATATDVTSDVATDTGPRDFGPPIPPALAVALEGALADHFTGVGAAAVAIGVRLPDGSWWEGVEGEACHEPPTAVVVGDRFRLGSITKTWVAAAVLQLVDEGRVSLDGEAGDYVPGFDLDPGITVARCLSHTTGLFDLTDDVLSIHADFSQPVDPRDIVRQSLEHGPDFAPGERYEYSNTNYFLLALIVEEVTGEPIAAVLRERMLDPLDLRDTFLEDAEPPTTTFVCGNVNDVDMTHLINMSWAWAAGAMVSSTGDLCRWAEALWRGDVVPEALRTAMMTPTVLPDGHTVGYGFGTMIQTRAGLKVVGHNGQTLGFQSELFIDPTSGLCVAVLANDFSASPEVVGRAAWDVLVPALDLR